MNLYYKSKNLNEKVEKLLEHHREICGVFAKNKSTYLNIGSGNRL